MGLTNDLISQFVKTTKDETKKSNESTHFGTIVEYDGGYYAKLDGTEQLTPILTTAKVVPGERVTVLLKDHSATVTGNISSPSASNKDVVALDGKVTQFGTVLADKVDTKTLVAEQARIDALYADNATITGKLIAQEASIKSLEAENLDISGRLNATEVNVGTLTADNAIIKGKLEVNELSLQTLNADVADINTLIFGSASGTSIQTSFANAVIAQLGNAQIKSAMIESVSAGKITAGDIITNNVRVMSEDGSLIISDETIQISDDTRVRVQIGKDAANDYSINIWDANGNLMFSEGGITDKAIKEAIIRNDMVAANANISGSKLDIQSVYSAMNADGSSTLKGSKIYLDDKGQTLDVAFTSMTSTVNSLTSTVSSQGTQLSAVQGQISSKIWKEDITTAVNDIELGGRNLLLDSKNGYSVDASDFPNQSNRTHGKITVTSAGYGNAYCWIGNKFSISPNELFVEIGEKFTYSIDIRVKGTFSSIFSALDTRNASHAKNFEAFAHYDFRSDEWVRIYGTGTVSDVDSSYYTSLFSFQWYNASVGSTIEYRNPKLERGNKATDWTPAPEDMEADIISLNTQYSNLVQDLNGISATVGQHTTLIANKADNSTVTEVSSRVTDLVANLDGFKTTVSNTYTTKTEFNNLEIGGRNLISHTYSNTTAELDLGGYPSSGYNQGLTGKSTTVLDKDEYVLSFEAKSTVNNDIIVCHFYDPNTTLYVETSTGFARATGDGYAEVILTTSWKRYWVKYNQNGANTTTTKTWIVGRRWNGDGSGSVSIRCIKLEEGHVPTAWTPAPEGMATAESMTNANTIIQQLSNKIGASVTESNPLGSRMSAIEQTASGLTVTLNETKNNLNNLSIGGRNYYRKNCSVTNWAASEGGNTFTRPHDDCPNGFYMIGGKGGDGTIRFNNIITSNGYWTVSFWVRGSQNANVSFTMDINDYAPMYVTTTNDNSWKHIEYTVNVKNYTESTYNFIDFSAIGWAYFYIKDFKVEKGNKATDWTPAPEDTEALSAKKINHGTYGASSADWDYWATPGHADKWGVSGYDNSHLNVGDTAYLVGTVGDAGGSTIVYIILYGTVTAVDSDYVYMTSLYYVKSGESGAYSLASAANTSAGNAQSTANTAKTNAATAQAGVNSLAVGVRNYVLGSDTVITNNEYNTANWNVSEWLTAGETYTVSMCVTPANGISAYYLYFSGGYISVTALTPNGTSKQILTKTFTMSYYSGREPSVNALYARPYIYRFPNDGTVTGTTTIHWIKIEKGSIATAYQKAPEDITSAAKTATNYLNFSSSGLVVGDMTASTLGRNVLIHSTGIDIRNNATVLARFQDSLIELGRHSKSAKIDLCNGTAQMYNEASNNPNLTYNKLVTKADHAIYNSAKWEILNEAYYDNNSLAYMQIRTGTPWSDSSMTVSPEIRLSTNKFSTGKYTQIYMSDDYVNIWAEWSEEIGSSGPTPGQPGTGILPEWGTAEVEVHGECSIRLDATANRMYLYAGDRIWVESPVEFQENIDIPNGKSVRGEDTGNTSRSMLSMSSNNNVIVGYGVYDAGIGNVHLYGNKIYHYVRTSRGDANYKPYYEAGDSITGSWSTSGFVTSSKTAIHFTIYLGKPIIGSPTVTVTSSNGLRLRQGDKYTHGSTADNYAIPGSISAAIVGNNAIRINATMNYTTDAINNDSVGIQASLTIKFS